MSSSQPRRALRTTPRWRSVAAGASAITVAAGLLLTFSIQGSAEVPSGWTQVAKDAYSRTLTNQWGSAEVGGAYSLSGVTTGSGVSGSAAYAKLGAGKSLTATLKNVGATNVNISDTVYLSGATTFDVLHGWNARQQSDGSAYSARVRISSKGKATLGVSRRVGSTSTWLGGVTLPFTVSAGQKVRGELQVSGTSPVLVNVRAWLTTATKPGWQIAYSDSGSSRITKAGSIATWSHVQTSNATVTVNTDDLSVGSSTASAPASPPVANPPASTLSTGGRGAASIGSASYSIPSGAIFVNPSSGSNTNSGSQSSPMKTVVAAAAKAPSGGTLVLRAGTYHESLTVASNKTITIQNYPGEAAWFDGSVAVTKWSKSGSVWVTSGWQTEFSNSMGGDAAFKARFIGSNSMAADPDQVFVNGSALRQVSSASAVTSGTFYVSDSANTITIGTDPSGKDVRASDLAQAINLSGKNSVIQGIGVRRYANGYEKGGAVRLGNTGGTLRNVVIQDVATIGLSLANANKTIDHVTIQRAGQMGIGGNQTDNSVVSNSIVSHNNTEHFKDAPVSGGMKFTAARKMTIKNNDASNNEGSGIWFDVSSVYLTIVNNTANGSTKHGIEVEVSDTGIIANNQAINGGEDGIILFDSGNFKVFNNEVGGSSLFGIKLSQDERRQSKLGSYPEARDSRYRNVIDPTVPWITKNIQLSNNVFGNGGLFQLYALDGKTNRAVDTWNLTINGNLFNPRPSKSNPTMVAWGAGDNKTLQRYETPAALAAAKNSGWRNAQVTSSKSITSMGADKTTYASTAVAIPSDVAAATGLGSGTKVLGTH